VVFRIILGFGNTRELERKTRAEPLVASTAGSLDANTLAIPLVSKSKFRPVDARTDLV
jgi:hypothetical protein